MTVLYAALHGRLLIRSQSKHFMHEKATQHRIDIYTVAVVPQPEGHWLDRKFGYPAPDEQGISN